MEHNPLLSIGSGYGGPHCPGHEAGFEGGDHPPVRPYNGPAPGSHGRARRPGLLFYDMHVVGMHGIDRVSKTLKDNNLVLHGYR